MYPSWLSFCFPSDHSYCPFLSRCLTGVKQSERIRTNSLASHVSHWSLMFGLKPKTPSPEALALAEQCRQEAEALYRSGKYHCAEAVLAAVSHHFRPDLPEEIIQMASGFGGGSGIGCLCGAVSGGTITLALVLQDDKKQITHLTRELHVW